MNQCGRTSIRYRNGLDSGFSCCAATEPKESVSFLELLTSSHRSSQSGLLTPGCSAEIPAAVCLSSTHSSASAEFGLSVLFLVACKYLWRTGEFRLMWVQQMKDLTSDQDTTDTLILHGCIHSNIRKATALKIAEVKSPCGSAVGWWWLRCLE